MSLLAWIAIGLGAALVLSLVGLTLLWCRCAFLEGVLADIADLQKLVEIARGHEDAEDS